MKSFRRFVFMVVGVLLLLVVAWGVFATFANYSDGYRVGQMLKLSRKGFLLKTWEGELSQGFLESNQDTGVATKVWPFSVEPGNEQALKDIQHAMDHGVKVKLHYREKYYQLPWVGDTKYVIYHVEEVRDDVPQPAGTPVPGSSPGR